MNFTDLQESYARFIGYPIVAERQDWQTQQIKDDINNALDEIVASTAYLWHHVRETTLALISGTTTYALNDFAVKPLDFWTEDTMAHAIEFVDPREADANSSKSSNAAYVSTGPYELTWYPALTAASKSGAAGATAGISVTEGSTTVTKGAGTAWVAGDVGSRIRLNGENIDFTIATFSSANSITIDRAYRARLTGIGQTGVGAGLTQAKWEITPAGTYQIQVRPAPTASKTIYYRYVKSHSHMLNTDDNPDLPERYHHLILDKAIIRSTKFSEDPNAFQMYVTEYKQGIADMIREDQIEKSMRKQVHYASPFPRQNRYRAYPPDIYLRGARMS